MQLKDLDNEVFYINLTDQHFTRYLNEWSHENYWNVQFHTDNRDSIKGKTMTDKHKSIYNVYI